MENKLIRGLVFRKNFISKKMNREFVDTRNDPLVVLLLSHLDIDEKDSKYIIIYIYSYIIIYIFIYL